ncbi:uncharacterized protein EI97DRAFT_477685 [Westerdykella ornata]|uniref:RNA polymerase II degradation factor 1 n=1 Tax=Westerdykella ornata TaxID=318751 RepID=A0A6A6JWG1_WESOR|nr:uncharacterized protein EI97DRAFT_477685 [Westerdykella ornata]KAF2280076.1 hypothetical protein EI97DRAFT_477685 [Westerdykella ornata]
MSEVQSRPARGRSTARGGRGGGAGSRGTRSNNQTNGDHSASNIDSSADQGELGELKRKYQSHLATLKELFPGWTDADFVLALEESDGDLQSTIEKISEGTVSQFAEVKTKDRARSKVKEIQPSGDATNATRGGARGDRTERRGGDSIRGGRGRATDRGRGGFRGGARGGAVNGPRPAGAAGTSIPTTELSAWNVSTPSTDANPSGHDNKEQAAPAPASAPKKTWASMFATPKPAPAPSKPAAHAQPAPTEPSQPSAEPPAVEQPADVGEQLPTPPASDESEATPIAPETSSHAATDKEEVAAPAEPEISPKTDELTQDNVAHLPDDTHGPPTETAASTVASSVATPLATTGQGPIGRPVTGGYATTALKAAGVAVPRSASFQKKLQEQQEAVVMPGNHAVDRAAVQFGSLGIDGEEADVDEDREDAETRTQPPQHSPVAQPRASLPPAPRQVPQAAEPQPQEAAPTLKQAPGLPPAPQQQPISQQSPSAAVGAQPAQPQAVQSNQGYNQFGRYGQGGIQQETSASQKPYDPFGPQTAQASQFDYTTQHTQLPHSQAGGFSSGPESFASQYQSLATEQQRNASAYNNYYSYNQQQTPSQQEAGAAQPRTGSAFGAGPNDSNFPSSQQQGQGRYGDAQNSGHTTPNPALGGQLPSGPASQGHVHQPHGQPGHTGGYPYNHPYYGQYYGNYMHQYGNYTPGGYGSFGGKGMYGQPHHYMSQFDQHSSSPANVGGFGQTHGRESGLAGSLGEYGRSASSAGQTVHGATAGGFGSLPDVFSRSQGYGGQASSYGQQQGGQQSGSEDSLKPFGDTKSGGPSPAALGAQPGRPGSAANNAPGQAGQGLPPQTHQQGFGGYPGHVQGGQNSQYGGLGGLGHQGAGHNQAGGYGNYGGFGGGYGSYRGGWGTNYGQH